MSCRPVVGKSGSEMSSYIPAIVSLCLEYITYEDEDDNMDWLMLLVMNYVRRGGR